MVRKQKNSEKNTAQPYTQFIDHPLHKHKVLKAKTSIEISNTILKLRKYSKLTKKEIAEKLGINKSEFIKIENGKNIPVYTIIKIADICGADINIKVTYPKH